MASAHWLTTERFFIGEVAGMGDDISDLEGGSLFPGMMLPGMAAAAANAEALRAAGGGDANLLPEANLLPNAAVNNGLSERAHLGQAEGVGWQGVGL